MDEEGNVNKTKDVDNKTERADKASKETAAVGEKSEEESTDKADEEDAERKEVVSKDKNMDKESKEHTATVGEKSLHRIGWEIHHRFFGVGLLATAWWQLHSGWELYEVEVGGEDLGAIFLGVAGGISGIIVIVYTVQKMLAKA
jgi:hypothetical protein